MGFAAFLANNCQRKMASSATNLSLLHHCLKGWARETAKPASFGLKSSVLSRSALSGGSGCTTFVWELNRTGTSVSFENPSDGLSSFSLATCYGGSNRGTGPIATEGSRPADPRSNNRLIQVIKSRTHRLWILGMEYSRIVRRETSWNGPLKAETRELPVERRHE